MRRHSLFDELDTALAGLVRSEPVELAGSWLPAARRTYERAAQEGSGEGPFTDVIDWRWRGRLSCSTPTVAVVFLVTADECRWSKSAPPAPQLDVAVSFHTYANYQQDRATFSAGVGSAILSAPVAWKNDPASTCAVAGPALRTARVATVAHTQEATFAVLVLPAEAVSTGRHRLWRVRERIAAALPEQSRQLLTRGRTGSLR